MTRIQQSGFRASSVFVIGCITEFSSPFYAFFTVRIAY